MVKVLERHSTKAGSDDTLHNAQIFTFFEVQDIQEKMKKNKMEFSPFFHLWKDIQANVWVCL